MAELPQRTPMKQRAMKFILSSCDCRELSTKQLYEMMIEKWPKLAPKKMTIARYCGELVRRGLLTQRVFRKTKLWSVQE
tara:strand:+ start:4615 stop:4851 length:237 start_codon:yes stop_codon:yes gene_type:complete